MNAGRAVGQTVPHAHLHVMPRRLGGTGDRRDGVRWIFPSSALLADVKPGRGRRRT
ncbi:MAG: HIT domain-containing protein [Actinobacteria bacterium]|nr:HIT domain-containing protein [Actinomycetota bacterium]